MVGCPQGCACHGQLSWGHTPLHQGAAVWLAGAESQGPFVEKGFCLCWGSSCMAGKRSWSSCGQLAQAVQVFRSSEVAPDPTSSVALSWCCRTPAWSECLIRGPPLERGHPLVFIRGSCRSFCGKASRSSGETIEAEQGLHPPLGKATLSRCLFRLQEVHSGRSATLDEGGEPMFQRVAAGGARRVVVS